MQLRLTLFITILLCIPIRTLGQTKSPEESSPPAVKEILQQLEYEVAQIQKEADKKIYARKRAAAQQLMILQDKLCKEGRLDDAVKIRDHMRQMLAQAKGNVLPDPGYFNNQPGGKVGEAFLYKVKGVTTGGSIYGSDIYTTDSFLAMAAVHSGALKAGETGIVKVTVLGRQPSYAKTTRHGITSRSYGPYNYSFKVERYVPVQPPSDKGILEDPGTLHAYRGKVRKRLKFEVTGSSGGTIWGSGIYTDDSDLSTVVVHAGILKPGEKGVVLVTILEGQDRYKSALQNGVTSKQWSRWVGSYRVSKVK